MTYQYHVQKQAMDIMNSIPKVPPKYPLMDGLPADYIQRFTSFCDFIKSIYLDISEQPEEYGMVCQDINEKIKWLPAGKGIDRLFIILHTISNGEFQQNSLLVDINRLKKCMPKVNLILKKLCDFGFIVEGFNGKTLEKTFDYITISYADDNDLLETMVLYFSCYPRFKNDEMLYNKRTYELWNLRLRRLDYKLTAKSITAIPESQWVADDIEFYSNYDNASKKICLELYNQYVNNPILSEKLQYKAYFNGPFSMEFYYKGRRFARTIIVDSVFKLAVKLRKMGNYMDYIYNLPNHIKKHFETGNCIHCQNGCKSHVTWVYKDMKQEGCGFCTFDFTDLNIEDVQYYIKLIELECLL